RTRAMLRRAELIHQATGTDRRPEETLRFHEIALDPVTYAVTLSREMLDLSRTEFDLMHLFMRYPGQVFPRADLLDRIWNASYSGQDRAVDYAIHRLRRKLQSMSVCIETVHGVGYRLQGDT